MYQFILSPLWRCSGCRHSPAGTAPHPGGSPGRPCTEEWIHSAGIKAGLLIKKRLWLKKRKASLNTTWLSNVMAEHRRLTWDCALISAPRLTRIFTTSAWPAREDMWSAVFPFWNQEKTRHWDEMPDSSVVFVNSTAPCTAMLCNNEGFKSLDSFFKQRLITQWCYWVETTYYTVYTAMSRARKCENVHALSRLHHASSVMTLEAI